MKKDKRKIAGEFKEFALKGNVVDLAVGIIIGGAFQGIVNSLVKDIFMPFIGLLIGRFDFSGAKFKIGSTVFPYGSFVTAVINFIILALVVFFLVKAINKVRSVSLLRNKEEKTPTSKECPYCKSEIAYEAVRCPHCTSDLED